MAKRFTAPAINWVELEKRVHPQERAKFFAFKAKSDSYLRRVQAYPPEPPKIDWDAYQKIVPIPGLVDKFKKEYESFKVPYPEDTLSSKIDEQMSSIQQQIKDFCAKSEATIKEVTKEMDKIKALPKFEDMTMEMVFDLYPEMAVDFVNKPSFWPHTADEQPGYLPPEQQQMKSGGGGH